MYGPGQPWDDHSRINNNLRKRCPDMDKASAALIRDHRAYLRPVWASRHWQVWEVVNAAGLVSGPAQLVRQTDDTVEVDARAAGEVVVRVRWTGYWTVDGPACVRPGADGWVHLDLRAPGRLLLHPVLLGRRAHCPAGTDQS